MESIREKKKGKRNEKENILFLSGLRELCIILRWIAYSKKFGNFTTFGPSSVQKTLFAPGLRVGAFETSE